MSDLVQAAIDRLSQPSADGWLIGTVKTINAVTNSLTVTLPSGDLSGLRWITSYTPTVNDVVAVAQIAGAWFVVGETSAVMTASTERTFTLPSTAYGGHIWTDPSWSWSYANPGQGKTTLGLDDYIQGGYLVGSLAGQIPSGATLTSAKLTMGRSDYVNYLSGPKLVSPVIYGTNLSGFPPNTSPVTVSGYGPWRPGTVTYGQTVTWDLPSTWVAAWLAGTLTGIATKSSLTSEYASWSVAKVSGTYTF